MEDFITKIVKCLQEKRDINECFREGIELAVNKLLQNELSAFLNYEKYDYSGRNSGDSRNGIYTRKLKTEFGTLNLEIPRDRNGDFHSKTIVPNKRTDDNLETTIIQLYKKGITTREISELIEKMYGAYYTPQTISNITKQVQQDVEAFHNRKINNKYIVIYCDATYIPVRRDTVAKEALHIIFGVNENGQKEVLDYALYPTESASNYYDLLTGLKNRGLEKVLLFTTDGLKGIKEKLLELFPKAKYQKCWTHLSRNVMKHIRSKDKNTVMNEFKEIHNCNTLDEAKIKYNEFVKKYKNIYPRAIAVIENMDDMFTYYEFPKCIKKTIYTTNIIENINKNLKRYIKRKEQFPNEKALDNFVGSLFERINYISISKGSHPGFSEAKEELLEMF